MTRTKTSELSRIEKFFLFCSATDTEVLKDCSKGIKGKYIALGWLVLTPAVMALWSGSYFFSTIFRNQIILSVLFGFVWALIILNIDRYLIITFDKGDSLFKDIFSFSVFSRMIIAVFIAYAIAHPIVLRLFSENIEEYIYTQNEIHKEEIRKNYSGKITSLEEEVRLLNAEINEKGTGISQMNGPAANPEISVLRKEIAHTGKEISDLRDVLNQSHEELSDEIAGSSSRTGRKGYGPVARSIEQKIESLNAQIRNAEKQYAGLEEQLASAIENEKSGFQNRKEALAFERKELTALEERNNALIADRQKEITRLRFLRDEKIRGFEHKAATDFLARSNALDELSKNNPNVRKWSYLLTLIFILLDILPILWKVIPRKDAYELKLETCRISSADFEEVERMAIGRMRDVREKTAIKGLYYESAKQEMGKLSRHKAELLRIFNNFFDGKVRQDQMFIERIKEEKNEADSISELDKYNKIEDGIHHIIKGYFNHTSDMTKAMIELLHQEDEEETDADREKKIMADIVPQDRMIH
ncbi:MAG: DUF4407 domain-containing protein [Desulfococcaceae bacterium]|jgi:hypothetical protein|nr:DUF4407 domain-containing protein [Desulfococcaceae bacterium]